jgi:hypothetical protein
LGVPTNHEARRAWRGTCLKRINCFPDDADDVSAAAVDVCRAELASGFYHAAVVVNLSEGRDEGEDFLFVKHLGESVRQFVEGGGAVAFPMTESDMSVDALQKLFGVTWKLNSYYRTTWAAVPENRQHIATTFGETHAEVSFSVKASSLKNVPRNDRCFAVTSNSRTQSMVPHMAGRDVSRPGEPDSVTASGGALEDDFDVAVATHKYGAGQIAYFGDVNTEEATALLIIGFVRNASAESPVPAWPYVQLKVEVDVRQR